MSSLKIMRLSRWKGVFVSLLIVFSIFISFTFHDVYSQEKLITAKSIGFEETTIIEFQNGEKSSEIEMIRMWLGTDFEFKSFKTEKGWTGKKTTQDVLIFTAENPLQAGDSVKFGIKTDKPKPGINWRAIDTNERDIQIGKTLVTGSPTKPSEKKSEEISGIKTDSSFRLIPEKPKAGSSIRVVGDAFGSNQDLDFFIGNNKLAAFSTNEDGHFLISTKIPENQKSERTDFFVKDKMGNQKTISLRIGESDDRMAQGDIIALTVENFPTVVHRGDVVIVKGTATTGGSVSAKIVDPNNQTITTIAIPVDEKGQWSSETIVASDAPLGVFVAEITDGKETIVKTWNVESEKIIQITPTKVKYEPGDVIKFNGTGIPNIDLEVIIENPQGAEVYSEIFSLDISGEFQIEYLTEIASMEGTYLLFAFQKDQTEVVLVGLGELPEVQIAAKMDKLNYKAKEKAIIALDGPPSSTVSLLVVDPSDKEKFSDTVIFGPDGHKNYELDLTGYASGVYTVVITRGNSQTSDIFTVGLKTGSGQIDIRTTKQTYHPGEAILVLGNSNPNILVTLTLIDTDGKVVKVKESFTNKEGVLSEDSFRLPTDAQAGSWTINARSGTNFDDEIISVTPSLEEGIIVFVEGAEKTPSGNLVTIVGFGAAVSQTVVIEITPPEEEKIIELSVFSTGEGEFRVLWIVPEDAIPGKYTIKASDPFKEAETTFELS